MSHFGGPDIHNMIADLTRTHTVQTPFTTLKDGIIQTAYHYTRAPALILQLQHATPSSSADARGSAGYGSRPAARLEALDTLRNIDREASAWIRHLGHDDNGGTSACVTRLGGLYPSQEPRKQKDIERGVRGWWNQARITTGYDSPAWRPDNSCPLCAEKGTLRVKLAMHTALCVGCWGTWDGATIALLADHIRAENMEDDIELPEEGDAA